MQLYEHFRNAGEELRLIALGKMMLALVERLCRKIRRKTDSEKELSHGADNYSGADSRPHLWHSGNRQGQIIVACQIAADLQVLRKGIQKNTVDVKKYAFGQRFRHSIGLLKPLDHSGRRQDRIRRHFILDDDSFRLRSKWFGLTARQTFE